MQFLLIAYDGTDDKALDRRLAVREAHIERNDELRDQGHLHFGVAILDQAGKMIGSSLVYEFDKREDLEHWLEKEPYIYGKVWEKIEIVPCRVGPSFAHIVKTA